MRYGLVAWGRVSPPSIPTCPQEEPWEAQEDAHRGRSRVKFSFCERPGVATRQTKNLAILRALAWLLK